MCCEKQGHGRAARAKPELVLNNFDTRLGHRLGRMLASLFHQDPAFKSRQVATFHNQRDYIFFRCAEHSLSSFERCQLYSRAGLGVSTLVLLLWPFLVY